MRENEADIAGYAALTIIKSERLRELTGEGADDLEEDAAPALFAQILSAVRANGSLLQADAYLEEGSEDLVNHFLVEDILRADSEMEEKTLALALERSEGVVPIAIGMCGDLVGMLEPDLHPPGLAFLLRLLGHLRPPEALPVFLRAAEECAGDARHEAVLALAKLGASFPGEVSARLRAAAGDAEKGEGRLPAVEVLGLLGRMEDNLAFLAEMMEALDPEDPGYHDLFVALVRALTACGDPRGREKAKSGLRAHLPFLVPEAIAFARELLDTDEEDKESGLAASLEDFVDEDILDLLEVWADTDAFARRATFTQLREDYLTVLEEEEAEEEEGVGGIDLLSVLEQYSHQPSLASERGAALGEFLRSLGRSRLGESGVEGTEAVEAGVFDDWFTYSRPLGSSGRTVVEELANEVGPDLEGEIADVLRAMAAATFSLFEVEGVDAGGTVRLRDVFGERLLSVRDPKLAELAEKCGLVAGFMAELGGRHLPVGNVMGARANVLGEALRFVDAERKRAEAAAEEWNVRDFLRRSGYRLVFELMRFI